MRWTTTTAAILAIGSTLSLPLLAADNLEVSADQRSDLSLTLYTQNLGLVREQRQLPVLQENQSVLIEDVSAQLQPETLRLKNAGKITEQNHNTDLLSYERLLEHHIGKKIQLNSRNPADGNEQKRTVRLLSVSGMQALVEQGNQIESIPLDSNHRFIFPSRPAHLTLKPGISFRSGGTSQAAKTEISYLTSGLSWQMDYVLELNETGDRASLNGMATLSNHTGTSFPDAKVKLLAGSINQPARNLVRHKAERVMMSAMSADSSAPSPARRQSLQDFHLYSLAGTVNLQNNQQKQVNLFQASDIAVQPVHRLTLPVYAHPQPERRQITPTLQLKFDNSQANQLGEPMPAGSVRVFSPDNSGQMQFTGGSNIANQAVNNEVTLQLGQAFDVTVEQQQTAFEKSFDSVIISQKVTVSNTANRASKLILKTPFNKRWELIESNQSYRPVGNGTEWTLNTPANSNTELTFRVRLFNK